MINLKKTLAALLAAVMTIAATAMPAMADSATLGDMTYNAYNNYDAAASHTYYYYKRTADGGYEVEMINWETIYPDVAPQIINDRTYLPLRAVGEGLGAQVNWDGNTRSVFISQ